MVVILKQSRIAVLSYCLFLCSAAALAQQQAIEPAKETPSKTSDGKPREKSPKAAPFKPTRQVVYKKIGDVELKLHIFDPPRNAADQPRPSIVFFFGGGWVGGSPSQFYPHCQHLKEKGMVAIAAEYRVKKKHGATPFQCVADAKSAVRWIRSHAKTLHIDPQRIAAGGGSAGGHLASATATLSGLNEPGEDATVDCQPNALVLFNPVYDNGPGNWGHKTVGARYREISPAHNIHAKMAPAIVFLGTNDKLIPIATAKSFQEKMRAAGVRSELKLYDGRGHGFFNLNRRKGEDYRSTVKLMDAFLTSIDFLPK